ncbi:PadR family transcriptional regulator [Persicobacter diffluens]|uniref:Transcription regulator PadR N-terminal domain-containing protein n=1 Tax=Persicobacter diffluens TaxID=981 RepID=A0AAN5AJD2_9BACT|nr:hypothetical protein PEDI_14160 [Persicobacter diffluens]
MIRRNTHLILKRGFIEFYILQLLSKGQIDIHQLIEKLKEVSLLWVEGVIFPILFDLKRNEYLLKENSSSEDQPTMRLYRITPKGADKLAALKAEWGEIEDTTHEFMTDEAQ